MSLFPVAAFYLNRCRHVTTIPSRAKPIFTGHAAFVRPQRELVVGPFAAFCFPSSRRLTTRLTRRGAALRLCRSQNGNTVFRFTGFEFEQMQLRKLSDKSECRSILRIVSAGCGGGPAAKAAQVRLGCVPEGAQRGILANLTRF